MNERKIIQKLENEKKTLSIALIICLVLMTIFLFSTMALYDKGTNVSNKSGEQNGLNTASSCLEAVSTAYDHQRNLYSVSAYNKCVETHFKKTKS